MHIGKINNNFQVVTHILEGIFSAVQSHCKPSRAGQLDRCTVLVSGSGVSGPRGAGGAALRFRFHSRDGRIVVRVRSNCACAVVGQKAGFHDATASQACIVIWRLKTRLSHVRAQVSHTQCHRSKLSLHGLSCESHAFKTLQRFKFLQNIPFFMQTWNFLKILQKIM